MRSSPVSRRSFLQLAGATFGIGRPSAGASQQPAPPAATSAPAAKPTEAAAPAAAAPTTAPPAAKPTEAAKPAAAAPAASAANTLTMLFGTDTGKLDPP